MLWKMYQQFPADILYNMYRTQVSMLKRDRELHRTTFVRYHLLFPSPHIQFFLWLLLLFFFKILSLLVFKWLTIICFHLIRTQFPIWLLCDRNEEIETTMKRFWVFPKGPFTVCSNHATGRACVCVCLVFFVDARSSMHSPNNGSNKTHSTQHM